MGDEIASFCFILTITFPNFSHKKELEHTHTQVESTLNKELALHCTMFPNKTISTRCCKLPPTVYSTSESSA